MDVKMKNTFVDIELETDEVVKATLTYYHLLQLKNKHKDIYDRYNKIMVKGPQDEFDNLTIIYTAYLCAMLAEGAFDDAMSEEEFISVFTPDREYMGQILSLLINPKKAKASANRSN